MIQNNSFKPNVSFVSHAFASSIPLTQARQRSLGPTDKIVPALNSLPIHPSHSCSTLVRHRTSPYPSHSHPHPDRTLSRMARLSALRASCRSGRIRWLGRMEAVRWIRQVHRLPQARPVAGRADRLPPVPVERQPPVPMRVERRGQRDGGFIWVLQDH